jgi:REP element-mobilizing transposase RayT
MPREKRDWVPGRLYHVMSRGSNRQPVVVNNGDYADFERILVKALDVCAVEAHAWAVMPNHWHGLVVCPADGLSPFMKHVNHPYALRFDRRWGRTGHVWQQRFKAVPQKTDAQYLWTLRYTLRNPVEAGLCSEVEDWRWTSLRATIGELPAPRGLRVDDVLANFHRDPEVALRLFRAFLSDV